jgi:hypothetical protein
VRIAPWPLSRVIHVLLDRLTHLTAVSGANLALLLAFLLTMARWAGVRGGGYVWSTAGVIIFIAHCRTERACCGPRRWGWVALAAVGSGSRTAGKVMIADAFPAHELRRKSWKATGSVRAIEFIARRTGLEAASVLCTPEM